MIVTIATAWITMRVKVGNLETRIKAAEEDIKDDKTDLKEVITRLNNIAQGLIRVEEQIKK